mgnify:FL=1
MNNSILQQRYRKIILLSLKIGIGSSLSLYIAMKLGMDYAISAGTITLLSLMSTKWETVRLSGYRIISFLTTVVTSWMLFTFIESEWIAYGILLGLIVFMAEIMGWRATISVNGVIAAHLVTTRNFSDHAIWNEFGIVVIGVTIALLFNLFNGNVRHKKDIIADMRQVENRLQLIVGALAAYLSNKEMERSVWNDICTLENDMQCYIKEAYEYQNNTFYSHPEYYISYFEMRKSQCQILHNLHYEMKKMRSMPKHGKLVAEYMLYLTNYINEYNNPDEQMDRLNDIFEQVMTEGLPQTREEFESGAVLYHVLMDIEEFLKYKKTFINKLDEVQLKKYWKK